MANNQNITYGSYLVDKNGSPINSIASLAQAPVDYRMKVKVLADLTNSDTWLAQEAAGTGIAGVFNSVYYGLITYVAEDGENNGLYVLQPPADTGSGVPSAADAAKTAANWVRISQSDTKIEGLTTRLTAVENKASANETAIGKKLDKDFVTSYTQGTIGEGTVFAARADNTPQAQNVYITGAQIKNFAASAVTDKGTFATEAALKEAYPTPEDGWTATVLETGTTWVVEDGQWKDSGTASGVTSVNGKTGNVVLVAADIDDVYSDVETDAAIKAAIDTTTYATLTTDNKTVLGSINEIDGLVTTNTSNIASNTSSIQGINSSIGSIQTELALKQNAAIDVTIQGEKETSITDALSSLDSALSAVKSTADGAARVDASNVDADTWKGVLGFTTTSEVAGQITNAITTDTYAGLNTTNKTVQGAINEIQSSTSGLPGKVTALEKSVATNTGNITQLQTTVGEHTQSISTLQTSLASKQNTAISIDGITAKTVEGALTEFNSEIDTLTAGLAGKANTADVVLKTDISTSIPSAGAVDTKVASEKAVADSLAAKQNTLKYYTEGTETVTIETTEQSNNKISIKAGITGLETGRDSEGVISVKFGVFQEDTVTQGLTVKTGQVDITAPGGFKINNSTPNVTTIVDSINLQSGGENALPTASAVRTAVNQIKTDLGSALTYKGSVDTYDQLPEEAEVGDTWNVAQAYQTYPAGTNYAWTGSAWDALGGSVDLSGYQTKSDDTLATTAKTVVGAINELNTKVTTNTSSIATNTASITALEDGTSAEIDVAGWKSKLGFITAADQVQPDWTAASGKAQILNKPDVETKNSVVVIGATNAIASVAGIVTNTQQVTTGSASLTCNYNVNGNAKLDFVSDAGDMIEILIANEGSSNFSVIKECTCGEDCLTITNVTWEASGNYAMVISYTATKDGDAKLSYMYGNA